MNVVFLSPHFPPGYYRFCVGLRDAGATVLGIGDAPWEHLHPALRDAVAEYCRVDDMHDHDQLLRAVGHFVHRYGRIDRIESLNEYWLVADARLRTDFNVPGIKDPAIWTAKRKSRMKEAYRAAGIPVAEGVLATSESDVLDFVDRVGFPVIAKPDVGVGAAGAVRLDDEAALRAHLDEHGTGGDELIEAWVDGRIVSYDGLADRDGEVCFEATLSYSTGVLDSVAGDDIHYYVTRTVPEDLSRLGRRVARAFDVRERPFHFEFFRCADGSLVALEVNLRPPGGLTVDMWDFANDIDFPRGWGRMVVQGVFGEEPSRAYHCLYAGRKAQHRYAVPHDELLRRFGDLIVHEQPIEDVFAAALGGHGYLLRSPDLDRLTAAAETIQARAY